MHARQADAQLSTASATACQTLCASTHCTTCAVLQPRIGQVPQSMHQSAPQASLFAYCLGIAPSSISRILLVHCATVLASHGPGTLDEPDEPQFRLALRCFDRMSETLPQAFSLCFFTAYACTCSAQSAQPCMGTEIRQVAAHCNART